MIFLGLWVEDATFAKGINLFGDFQPENRDEKKQLETQTAHNNLENALADHKRAHAAWRDAVARGASHAELEPHVQAVNAAVTRANEHGATVDRLEGRKPEKLLEGFDHPKAAKVKRQARQGLIPKKVVVTRDGHTHIQTVWVKPAEAAPKPSAAQQRFESRAANQPTLFDIAQNSPRVKLEQPQAGLFGDDTPAAAPKPKPDDGNKKLAQRFHRLTDQNYHIEAAQLIAQQIQDKSPLEQINAIQAIHQREGSLSVADGTRLDEARRNALEQLKQEKPELYALIMPRQANAQTAPKQPKAAKPVKPSAIEAQAQEAEKDRRNKAYWAVQDLLLDKKLSREERMQRHLDIFVQNSKNANEAVALYENVSQMLKARPLDSVIAKIRAQFEQPAPTDNAQTAPAAPEKAATIQYASAKPKPSTGVYLDNTVPFDTSVLDAKIPQIIKDTLNGAGKGISLENGTPKYTGTLQLNESDGKNLIDELLRSGFNREIRGSNLQEGSWYVNEQPNGTTRIHASFDKTSLTVSYTANAQATQAAQPEAKESDTSRSLPEKIDADYLRSIGFDDANIAEFTRAFPQGTTRQGLKNVVLTTDFNFLELAYKVLPKETYNEYTKAATDLELFKTGKISMDQFGQLQQLRDSSNYHKVLALRAFFAIQNTTRPGSQPRQMTPEAKEGDTKTENGKTYRLNKNHRWELVEDEAPPVIAVDKEKVVSGLQSTIDALEQKQAGLQKNLEDAKANTPQTAPQVQAQIDKLEEQIQPLRDAVTRYNQAPALENQTDPIQEAAKIQPPSADDATYTYKNRKYTASVNGFTVSVHLDKGIEVSKGVLRQHFDHSSPIGGTIADAVTGQHTQNLIALIAQIQNKPPAPEQQLISEIQAVATASQGRYALGYSSWGNPTTVMRQSKPTLQDLTPYFEYVDTVYVYDKRANKMLRAVKPGNPRPEQPVSPEPPQATETPQPAPEKAVPTVGLESGVSQATQSDSVSSQTVEEALRDAPEFGFDKLVKSTKVQRQKANEKALELAKTLKAEGRTATESERGVLAGFTGEGGLSGDLNAHYTPTRLAATMWHLLGRAGFNGGTVLEPSMGAGVFLETAPENAKMTGVEYNADTGLVAEALFPQHSIHGGMSFEEFNAQNPEKFDALISNPPYGTRGRTAMYDRPDIKEAESYFMLRGLERVQDGGVAAFLVNGAPAESAGQRNFRARLLCHGDIKGVYQLPQSVFKDSSSAVPPVLFVLKRRPAHIARAMERLFEKHGEKALEQAGIMHQEFLDGVLHLDPKHMIGSWDGVSMTGQFGAYKDIKGELDDTNLTKLAQMPMQPDTGLDTETELERRFAGSSMENAQHSALMAAHTEGDGIIPEGTISEDGLYVMRNHRWHKISDDDPELASALGLSQGFQQIGHLLANGQRASAEKLRQQLKIELEQHTLTHGDPTASSGLKGHLKNHLALGHLMAGVKGGELADHLRASLHDEASGQDMVARQDAFDSAIYLAGQNNLTPERLAQIWTGAEGSPEKALSFLLESDQIAITDEGDFVLASNFYHGQVFERADDMLELAERQTDPRKRAKYERQYEMFNNAIPKLSFEQFYTEARSKFVPLEALSEFVQKRYGIPFAQVTLNGGFYRIVDSDDRDYDAQRNPKVAAFARHLNNATRVGGVSKDLKGAERDAAVAAARAEAKKEDEEHTRLFSEWLSTSPYREATEDGYARQMNGYVAPAMTGVPLELDEWNAPTLHSFQNDAVRMAEQNGNSILALDVGLGKTFTGLALMQRLRQTGQAKRIMITAPKSLLGNWRENIARATPSTKVVIIGQSPTGKFDKDGREIYRDDDAATVARKFAEVSQGLYDVVITTRDRFKSVPLREESYAKAIQADTENMRASEAERGSDKDSVRTLQEKMAKMYQKAAEKISGTGGQAVYFEDLGIDAVIADEAHSNKNLHSAPNVYGQSPKYMGGGAESIRAYDWYLKTAHIHERTGGKGVHALTATPTKNSPLEIFNMLKPVIGNERLRNMGIYTVKDFVARYCEIEDKLVPALDGQFVTRPAVVGFKNLHELRRLLGRWQMRYTADDAMRDGVKNFRVPTRTDIAHEFDMTPEAQAMYAVHGAKAKDAAAKAAAGFPPKGEDHAFGQMALMRKLTLDQSLHPELGQQAGENPRFTKAAEITANALAENGKVVMFMDMGRKAATLTEDGDDGLEDKTDEELQELARDLAVKPEQSRANLIKDIRSSQEQEAANAYERLVQHLEKQGIKREEIEIVTSDTAKSSDQRTAAAERFKNGITKVVIGSTGVIGEGFNLQYGTTDMVHLDMPWDPGTYQQRLGRAQRQGNPVENVRNHMIFARNSFDALTYDTMQGKQGWMDILYNGTSDTAEIDNDDSEMQLLSALDSLGDDNAMREAAQKRKAEKQAAIELAKRQRSLQQFKEYNTKIRAAKLRRKDAADHRANGKDGYAAKAETAAARLEADARKIAEAIKTDSNIPTEYHALLEDNAPDYLQHPNGSIFPVGGLIRLGTGELRRVAKVNHINNTVITDSFGVRHNEQIKHDMTDLAPVKEIHITPTHEHTAEAIRKLVARDGSAAVRQIAPLVSAAHDQAIQQGMRQYALSNQSYGSNRPIHTVNQDGVNILNLSEIPAEGLPEGERFLTNSLEDRKRYMETVPHNMRHKEPPVTYDNYYRKMSDPEYAHKNIHVFQDPTPTPDLEYNDYVPPATATPAPAPISPSVPTPPSVPVAAPTPSAVVAPPYTARGKLHIKKRYDGTIGVSGDTYAVKNGIKALGAKWDGAAQEWKLPNTQTTVQALARLSKQERYTLHNNTEHHYDGLLESGHVAKASSPRRVFFYVS